MKPFYSLKLLILIALLSGWNQSSIAQVTTLSYTGAVQTFTVPAGVTVISVDMQGARGGANYFGYSAGGGGGRVQCMMAVTGGQVLQVYVGGQGNVGPTCCIYGVAGGFNGGGNSQYYYSGSGGGATDIRSTAGVLTSRLVVAGGGGGAGYYSSATNSEKGGCGGNLTGENGYMLSSPTYSTSYCGQGGTQTAGGAAGSAGCASAGGLGTGGLGSSCYYGGGGGAGYYGGGGSYYGAGGGGSSFTDPTACSSVTLTQCANTTGNGVCSIYVPPAGGTASPGALNFGPIVVGNTSASQTFRLVAYNLSPASGNLTLTAPTSFQVSVDGGVTYGPTASLPYTSGGITTTIYVRFAPLTYSIFAGVALNITGGGIITPITELLSGQGVFPCSGTPTSGPATVSPTSGGSATTFALSLPSASIGGGVTYQWQMWSFSTGGFQNIVGATTVNYNYTGNGTIVGINADTYFRCIVTCPGGGSSTSGVVLATLAPAAANCSGLPNPGVVTTPTAAGCLPSFTTGVFLTGVSVAPGIRYNWQTSTDNVNWTTVAGATSPFYFPTVTTTTYIRDSVTCANSLLSNYSAPQLLTVNPLPTAITNTSICNPFPSFMTSTPSGGSWTSANPSIASVVIGTGLATGVTAGVTTVTYTLPTGCQMTASVTVNNAPAAISGSSNVCVGTSTPLFETTTGGTWSSSNTLVATVSGTGILSGVASGNATITYTTSTGCIATKAITVNSLPSPITGSSSVCIGQTITLANPTPGGTWFSGSFTASCDMTAGVVTGLTAGTSSVTYRLSTGCTISKVITINALPSPISGSTSVCAGSTSLLSGSGGGAWSSSDPSIFSIDAAGNVTGIAAGRANVSYTLSGTGCFVSSPMAINARPGINTVTGGGAYCATGAGVHIGLNGSFANVNYQIIESISGTYGATLSGSSAALDFGVFATVGTYVVEARDTITGCTANMAGSATVSINTPPTAFNVIGGGNYCVGTGGVLVQLDNSETGVAYQLMNGTLPVGTPITGTGAGVLNFGLQTVPGTYTVAASNLTSLCANNMTGSATVATNPLPVASSVMGGGNYCMGGTGSDVYISASDASVNYTLYNGVTPVATLPGDIAGGALHFGSQTADGVYTVVGSDATTFCHNNMNGNATIHINPLPTVYTVTGGGNYCFGTAGVHVGLNNSSTGTTYTVTGGGSIAGSNSGIDFGLMTTAGSYNITAVIDATGCTTNMAGTAVVGVSPLPSTYNVIGGGAYCAGGAGSEILLDNSDAGITYQLYMGATPVGASVAGTGTGSSLSFGFQHAAGTYTIGAVNAATTCVSTMIGSQSVTINPNPTVYNVSRGANYCSGGAGVDITLDGSQNTVVYQLILGGFPYSGGVPGTGAPTLDMGVQSVPGVYTVIGTDPVTNCTSTMNGSSAINVNPTPAIYSTTGGGNYCVGGAGRHVGLALSSVGINYTLTRPSGAPMTMAGTGFSLDFGTQLAPGAYTITAVNPLTSCSSSMSTPAVINIVSLPTAYTVTGSGQYCAGGAGLPVGVSTSDSFDTYSLYNASGALVAGPLTGVNGPLSFGLITTTGTYTVKATDIAYGCINTMASSAVIVSNPLPSVYAVTGGGSFCAGGTGVHVGLSNANAGITYTATNGTFSTALTPSVNGALDFGLMTNGGTYTVSALNATTTCASNMSGSKVVNVNPTVTPAVTIGGNASTCSGDVTTYTAVPVNGGTPTYAWKVNGGSVVSTSSTYSYAPTTGDILTLTMNSNAPCATTTVANGNLPITVTTKLTPSVSISTSSAPVCPGAPMTFTAAPVNGGAAPFYAWKVNGAPVAGASSSTLNHNAAAGDVVFCVMTSNLACRTMDNVTSNNIAENVDVPVTPEFTMVADPGTNIFKYSNVNFSLDIHVAGFAPSFAWKVNNGTTASTTATFSTANLRNNDTVSCTVTSNSPCGTKSYTRYMVMSVSALGVNTVASVNDFNILPNPNNGAFTVKGTLATSATEEVTIDVTNMLGQVVYSSKVMAQGGSINEQLQLSNSLANGMYLLNLHTSTGNAVFHFEIQK